MLKRKELMGPVTEAVRYYGGAATTNQIESYLRDILPNQIDGYSYRWSQQLLSKSGVLAPPVKRGGCWTYVGG